MASSHHATMEPRSSGSRPIISTDFRLYSHFTCAESVSQLDATPFRFHPPHFDRSASAAGGEGSGGRVWLGVCVW